MEEPIYHELNRRRRECNAERAVNDERFHAKLLQIAKEYPKYRRVDSNPSLAILDCRAPSKYLGVPRVSASDDESTHGKKLYYLYAKKQQAYRNVAKSAQQQGQVVVKETWEARPIKSKGPIARIQRSAGTHCD